MEIKPHKKLKVYQKTIELAKDIYSLTEGFPSEEKFGLVNQMRRAVVSISSNIAEGAARKSRKEKIQFFITARGSLSELDSQLEISHALGFIDEKATEKVIVKLEEISRMLQGLINSCKKT